MLDDVKVLVRCISLWKSHAAGKPNEPWGLDVVLQDQEGNRIQAHMKGKDLMNKFIPVLDEGSCYRIRNFRVGENGGKYPLLNHRYKINFYKNTSITRVNHFDQNLRGFKFEPFQNFTTKKFGPTDLVDVIGTIVSISNLILFESYGKEKYRRTITLQDVDGHQLECCFYEKWAEKFNSKSIIHSNLDNANKPSLGNALFATKLYINDKLPEIEAFKRRYQDNDGYDEKNHAISLYSPVKKEVTIDEFFADGIKKMVGSIRESGYGYEAIVYAKVHKIHCENGWTYIGCKQCGSSAKEMDSSQANSTASGPKYKVIVRVIDDTGIASLLLFDDMINKFVGIPCYKLKEKDGVNAEDIFHEELTTNIVEDNDMFQIPTPTIGASMSKLQYQDSLPFNIKETPKSKVKELMGLNVVIVGNGNEHASNSAASVSGGSDKGKRNVIDLDEYDKEEASAKRSKKPMRYLSLFPFLVVRFLLIQVVVGYCSSTVSFGNQSNLNNSNITSTPSDDLISLLCITQLSRSTDTTTDQLIHTTIMNNGVGSSSANLYTPQTTHDMENTHNASTKAKRGSNQVDTVKGFSLCCGRGKVRLPVALKEPPPLLKGLVNGEHPKSKSFMENIRRYNSMFAFTSMGGNVDNSVNKGSVNEIENRIGVVSSRNGGSSSSNSKIDMPLTKDLKTMLDRHNHLVKQFCMESLKLEMGQKMPNVFSTILSSKWLFQQFLVDGYTMVEAERMLYIRNQKSELRCETYSRLAKAAESGENKKRGSKVVLPSSFTDRPDVTTRVFKMKLDQLIKDIKERHIFGKFKAEVNIIEFQKRSLPHYHLCVWSCPCMENNKCSKKFPRKLNEETFIEESSYVIYKRSENGRSIKKTSADLDNTFVVPYNPTLLRRYQDEQIVVFDPSESIDYQVEKALLNTTKFLKWMETNKTDEFALTLLKHFVMLIVSETMSRPEVVWEKTWRLLAEDVLEIERKKRNHPGYALLSNSKSLENIVNMPYPDAQFIMENYNSGIAALLLNGGRTAHSQFGIPINIVEDSLCTITADSDLANLFRETKLIIWNEAQMVHNNCFKAFDRTLRDIATRTYNNFSDKLTENMHLRVGCNPGDADLIKEFAELILRIGDGKIGGKNDGHAKVEFPEDMLMPDSLMIM
nr:replication protein A 70 kDa DNA-binding subunit B [Tanacetum cinerariifolium]